MKYSIIILLFSVLVIFGATPYYTGAAKKPSGYTYFSSIFDGTNDYLTRDAALTGNSASKTGLFSVWVKMIDGDTGFHDLLVEDSNFLRAIRWNDGQFRIIGHSGSTAVINMETSNNSVLIADGWVHILASWDASTAGGDDDAYILLNGVDDTTLSTFTDNTVKYDATNWGVGAGSAGGNKFDGLMCEMYFTNEYLDATTALAAFASGGKPKDLTGGGAAGALPTGTAPWIYFANEFSTFQTNLGTGGGFTENGALTDGGADIP